MENFRTSQGKIQKRELKKNEKNRKEPFRSKAWMIRVEPKGYGKKLQGLSAGLEPEFR
jgi:hypothetical protein